MILEYLGLLCMSAGVFFMLTGSMGMLRMPDFYTRIHSAGITDALGSSLVLFGLIIDSGISLFSGKILILIILMMLTGPTSTHIIAKAAMLAGLQPWIRKEKK